MRKGLHVLTVVLASVCLIGTAFAQQANPALTDATAVEITPDGVTITSRFSKKVNSFDNSGMVTNGDLIFMSARRAGEGAELWTSNGTEAGTDLLVDIEPGDSSSSPRNFVVVGNLVFFAATTSTNGTELWVTDGTANGTFMVKDINPGTASSNPQVMTAFGDRLLFGAVDETSAAFNDGTGAPQMWISDGSDEGTYKLSLDNENGVIPRTTGDSEFISLIQSNDSLAFFVGSDGIHGTEMWVTNGTPEPWGTRMLIDIDDNADTANTAPNATLDTKIEWIFSANEEQILFRANTPAKWVGQESELDYIGEELWVTDGTRKGTYPLGDFNPALDPENSRITQGTQFAFPEIYDGKILFRADPGAPVRVEPCYSDLTPAGTKLIADINVQSDNNAIFGPNNTWLQPFIPYNQSLLVSLPVWSDESILGDLNTGRELYEMTAVENFTANNLLLASNLDEGGGWASPATDWGYVVVDGILYTIAGGPESDDSEVYAIEPNDGGDPPMPDSLLVNEPGYDNFWVYIAFNDANIDDETPHDLLDFNGTLVFVDSQDQLWTFNSGRDVTSNNEKQYPAVTTITNDDLNEFPVGMISAPAEGSEYVAPEDITLSVAASDTDGSVSRVDYYDYQGNINTMTLIGSSDSDPFDYEWRANAGEYGILAIIYDDANDSSFTLPVNITVVGNQDPTISIASPSDGASFTEGDNIGFGVNVADADGEITRVKYFVDENEVAEVTASPFSYTWEQPEVGTYSVTAVAYDDKADLVNFESGTDTSAAISVAVEQITVLDDFDGKVSIYPNPTEGSFSISFAKVTQGEIMIYSTKGDLVRQAHISGESKTISLEGLNSALYIVKIVTADDTISGKIRLK